MTVWNDCGLLEIELVERWSLAAQGRIISAQQCPRVRLTPRSFAPLPPPPSRPKSDLESFKNIYSESMLTTRGRTTPVRFFGRQLCSHRHVEIVSPSHLLIRVAHLTVKVILTFSGSEGLDRRRYFFFFFSRQGF